MDLYHTKVAVWLACSLKNLHVDLDHAGVAAGLACRFYNLHMDLDYARVAACSFYNLLGPNQRCCLAGLHLAQSPYGPGHHQGNCLASLLLIDHCHGSCLNSLRIMDHVRVAAWLTYSFYNINVDLEHTRVAA